MSLATASATHDLAARLTRRRRKGSWVSTGVLLVIFATLSVTDVVGELQHLLFHPDRLDLRLYALIPVYLSIYFLLAAMVSYPVDLYFGYLGDREFGVVKNGIRAWTRDWIGGVTHQGVLFVIGGCILLVIQGLAGGAWLGVASFAFAILILLTAYFEADLIPTGLVHFRSIDPADEKRLRQVLPADARQTPIVVYSANDLREMRACFVGLGRRAVLLISQPAMVTASDEAMRTLLGRAASQRGRMWIAPLTAWVVTSAGLGLSHLTISPDAFTLPAYIGHLAPVFSAWMLLMTPVMTWIEKSLAGRQPAQGFGDAGRMEIEQHNLSPLSPPPALSLAARVYRLTLWTPNLAARSLRRTLGHPVAWFVYP